MNIAFDISALAEPMTGIGQYRFNLLRELLVMSHESRVTSLETSDQRLVTLNIIPYGFNFRSFEELIKIKEIKWASSPLDKGDLGDFVFKIFKLPRKPLIVSWIFFRRPLLDFFVKDADLFHVSDNVQSPTRKPTVATIHDLSAILYPQFHSRRNVFVDKFRFKQIVKYASQVICVSENSKNDFLNRYKFDKDRIHVIYNGIDHNKFFPIRDFEKIQKVKEKYNLFNPFILFLGTIEPRKNVLRLIKAYFELKNQQKIIQKLVICGKKGWFYDEIFEFVKKNKLENDVIFLGYLDENDKNALINASEFVIYPSLYEGFGIPVIEAMACAKAVITSNISSLPEVGGNAALYCDPNSTDDISDKMLKLIADVNLRKELEKKSLVQASKFSWKQCAKETMRVYKIAILSKK